MLLYSFACLSVRSLGGMEATSPCTKKVDAPAALLLGLHARPREHCSVSNNTCEIVWAMKLLHIGRPKFFYSVRCVYRRCRESQRLSLGLSLHPAVNTLGSHRRQTVESTEGETPPLGSGGFQKLLTSYNRIRGLFRSLRLAKVNLSSFTSMDGLATILASIAVISLTTSFPGA